MHSPTLWREKFTIISMTRNAAAIFDTILAYTLEVGVRVCLSATRQYNYVISSSVIMKESVQAQAICRHTHHGWYMYFWDFWSIVSYIDLHACVKSQILIIFIKFCMNIIMSTDSIEHLRKMIMKMLAIYDRLYRTLTSFMIMNSIMYWERPSPTS